MSAIVQPFPTFPRSRSMCAPALRAEWTKLRTHRTTWRSALAAVVVGVSLGAIIVASVVSRWNTMSASQRHQFDPASQALVGMLFAIVILAGMAVRSITGEYSTGMIRTTFTAVPRRRTVLVSKAVAVGALVFPVALVADVLSFQVGQWVMAGKHIQMSIWNPGALRAIVLGAVATSLIAMVGVGLGGLLRRTTPATTLLALLFLGGGLFAALLPVGARPYLPSLAAQGAVSVRHATDLLRPAAGIGVLAIYAVVTLGLGAIRLSHQDS